MADMTEPKRISEQLEAAHERFTTVLESLDDAVSVRRPARRRARATSCCSRTAATGSSMAPTPGAPAPAGDPRRARRRHAGEAYDGELKRWFDVRTREIRWVDGRDVRLQIATDISDRKATEEIVRQQQEKVQLTSRLMTMGEMASSLAHELNQPLTAISNYSLGTVSRLRDGNVTAGGTAARAGEDGRPGAARRQHHPSHPRVREARRAATPPDRR